MFNSIFLYIDPGTGSAIFAMVIGVMAGATMYIRTKWQTIRSKNISNNEK